MVWTINYFEANLTNYQLLQIIKNKYIWEAESVTGPSVIQKKRSEAHNNVNFMNFRPDSILSIL